MLYEFAITPDVFDGNRIKNSPEPKLVSRLLAGLYESGLVANLHGSLWEHHTAQRLLANCPPNVRDKVLTCLRVLKDRKRLVLYPKRADADPTDDIEWLDVALGEHRRSPFHAIVLGKELLDTCTPGEPCCIELEEILDSPKFQELPTSQDVTKNEASYRAALTPLLRHTRMLRIVDPYMTWKEPCLKTIRLCAELLGKGSHEAVKRRLQIHTDPTKGNYGLAPNDCLVQWEAVLQPIAAHFGHEIEVFLWETRTPDHRFHDRFLLTDQCGIGSQDSFECVTGLASTTRWFLLPSQSRQNQNAALRPETTRYIFRGKWTSV